MESPEGKFHNAIRVHTGEITTGLRPAYRTLNQRQKRKEAGENIVLGLVIVGCAVLAYVFGKSYGI